MAKFVDIGTPMTIKASDLRPGTLVNYGSPAVLAAPGVITDGCGVMSLITGYVNSGDTIVTPLLTGQTITLAQE